MFTKAWEVGRVEAAIEPPYAPPPPPAKPSPNIRGLGAEGRKTGQRIVAGRLGWWSNEKARKLVLPYRSKPESVVFNDFTPKQGLE
jgi:hypothetical protein